MPSKTVPAPPSSSPAHPAGGSGEGQKDIAVSPSSSPARLAGGGGEGHIHSGEVNDGNSDGYAPTTPINSPLPSSVGDPDDLGDPNEIDPDQEPSTEGIGAMIASGNKVSKIIETVEKGVNAVASIFLDALEKGGVNEEPLSARLAKAMAAVPKPKVGKKTAKGRTSWFVEFCCSKRSEICKLAEEMNINYIGLSREMCNLLDPNHMNQVMEWALERKSYGDVIHVWGSLPCTPWSSWQHLNLHVKDGEFAEDLEQRREEFKVLVSNFHSLSEIAIDSGGSSSFEWPRWCSGWEEVDELTLMITKFSMFSTYPCGCAFDLTIKGKKPLKPWRIVTTDERVAVEMGRRTCKHPKGYKHDRLEGGNLSYLSGFYNRSMAASILCSLFPKEFMEGIPAMPTVVEDNQNHNVDKWERIADLLNSGTCLQHAMGLVHRVLSRQEIKSDPKAGEAIRKEAAEVRAMGVWDDSSVCEVSDLKEWAKQKGKKVHIAEVMEVGSIKHDELGPTLAQHKGRLVFRGDATRDENGLPAKFRELHSQPASIQIVSLVLLYGMMESMVVHIADCKKAYLQAILRSPIATWVVLPFLCWLPGWEHKFKRPCVRLRRALYGHPEAGDDWFAHLSEVLESKMGFKPVEGMPSLWWNPTTRVLTAAYVDDIMASGPAKACEEFWKVLRSHVTIDEVTTPGRFLGRDHSISKDGREVFLSMKEYCLSAVDLYLKLVGDRPLKPVSTPYLDAELNASDWETRGELGERSASILMKILWLARLSRPDLSHAVTKLASGITRWSTNHDKMLYRLVCYMSATTDFGVLASMKGTPDTISLHLFTDADLGGDVCTMKSHSGIYLCVECPDGSHFPISWTSRRQQRVSKSTAESELVAMKDGLYTDALPVQTVLELILGRKIPLILHEDNRACIHILGSLIAKQ